MISALARSAQVLDDRRYVRAAVRAMKFILKNMRDGNGRMVRRYRNGSAGIAANLRDYAYLIQALLDLYETVFDEQYLKSAISLQTYILNNFWDRKLGGYYFTAMQRAEHAGLPSRRKEIYDGSLPSGNSVAMSVMIRIARLSASGKMEARVFHMAEVFSETIRKSPVNHTRMLMAMDTAMGPGYEIVVSGSIDDPRTKRFLQIIRSKYLPRKVVLLCRNARDPIIKIIPYIKSHVQVNARPSVYVCRNYRCKYPIRDPSVLDRMLRKQERAFAR